ncbi:MAG TPA: SDR family oxidoreductase [Longimicrobiaceae bacterium]
MILSGRVVVVTGGSRGIGRACVLAAVAQGADVIFCSRTDGADSREVEAAARRIGTGTACGVAADVSDERSIERLFEIVRDRYGVVHATVNNAAVSREQLLVSLDSADWDAVVATNLTGGFLVARESLRAFLDHGQPGRIVSIGSLSQYGAIGNASYAVSKGGLWGLTRAIARQYAERGVVANMVVPGYVETALSAALPEASRRALIEGCPMRRAGTPEEIAAAVVFLLSDAATPLAEPLFAAGGFREVPP